VLYRVTFLVYCVPFAGLYLYYIGCQGISKGMAVAHHASPPKPKLSKLRIRALEKVSEILYISMS